MSESNVSLLRCSAAMGLLLCSLPQAWGHDSESHSLNAPSSAVSKDVPDATQGAKKAQAFKAFEKTVKVRVDGDFLLVESNGLPTHNMMVGIRSWQQQVPLPQPFTGKNAWRLPWKPKLAAKPISVKKTPLRGAIALAVNGVPIFCALNNRGEDAYLAGELDQWGGHCGRGDDYHYHTAPVHLEKIVGKGKPIAFALDGFPIYGYTNKDGSAAGKLDEYNGQFDADGNYHYHATKTFPYINGGLRGVVTLKGDQVDQPRDSPIRPGQEPLRGAEITAFSQKGQSYRLEYKVRGKKSLIEYSVEKGGLFKFTFTDAQGVSVEEEYRRREGRGPRPPRPGDGNRPPRPGDGNRPPRPEDGNRPPRPEDGGGPPPRPNE